MKRRAWLLSAAGAAGALVIGWSVLPPRSRLGSAGSHSPAALRAGREESTGVALNGWIKILDDGSVVLAMPRSEMGQGVHTALAMLVAEELDVPLARVSLEQAGSDTIYGNVAMLVASLPFHPMERDAYSEEGVPQVPPVKIRVSEWLVGKLARELGINATGASSSVADAWEVLRMAAATARASLLGAASLDWKLPVDELSVSNGVISHPSGPSAHYGELARFAAATPPGEVTLKDRKDWKLIGQSAPRQDVPAKVNGSALFGLDVRLPGMVFASVRLCPMLGGSPGAINPHAALGLPGVERLVRLPAYAGSTAGFAVVGKTWWHAQQGALAVQVDWQQRPAGALDSRLIEKELETVLTRTDGFTFYETGAVETAEAGAVRKIDALYRAPYLAHATLEPMNCTAQVVDGKVLLWAPTQVPQMAVAAAARVAGVAVKDVKLTVTLLGGGFGRRLEVDFVAQAVRVAMECGGRPVQLIWSREEDTTHDFYRPMHVAMLRAAVNAEGQVTSLRIKSAGDAITPRWMARGLPALSGPVDTPDKTTAEGLFDLPYGFASQKMSHVATRMGVPVGFWRSVGHSHNAFFSESFIDELAWDAKQDPLAFRRALLSHAPRHLAVLDMAAGKAGWSDALPAGRARGLALHESFGSIVAQVVEVSLVGGTPRVHRVVCAIDCGTVINPGIVAQQMEGAVVFALTAALYGRVDIHEGVVQQKNFHDYPMLQLAQAPLVQTYMVSSTRPPAGVGEPGVPPLAPALAGALFTLTGKRMRSLPLSLQL
ncbi:xanthine dehydrogenase family protein molybdopterin-binding subunit [Polaromonas sp. JS666]|uniref:xanthine dehydrogenase family protein molybdopterin-binding subunit n=1 Tax=Polaromonas sp. (strain JS666 / ATCC BAA-500) TaxID=296591 RepID=UPI00004644C1|nr:molybdopterin cofactor-binding domain-containing protein [Polaromonas sp. JS666]ABE46119.1 putative transmembrane isoquinoline 1-oxidoreductase (beta subunit) oxidoreductase protein [Polaromonas sp. JS666]